MRISLRTLGCLALAAALVAGCSRHTPPPPIDPPARPAAATGPVVVDVRDPLPFAKGFYPGALNLQTGFGQLRLRLHDLVGDQPIKLVAESQAQLDQARRISQAVGTAPAAAEVFQPAAGTAALPLLTTADLHARLAAPDPPVVLDVRSQKEYAKGAVPGALYLYPNHAASLLRALRKDGRYVAICEEGWRSSTVASLLLRDRFEHVWNAHEGMKGWRRAGYPMHVSADESAFLISP